MKITIGGKTLTTNSLLEEGTYLGKILSLREGDKTVVGSECLNTIVFGVEIYCDEGNQTKEKKMIFTDRKNSELSNLLDEFSYLQNEEGSIDLTNLIGEECEVEIVHNISKRGNIFANIVEIRSVEEDLEIEG